MVKKHIDNMLDMFCIGPEEFFEYRSVELYGGDPLIDYKRAGEIFSMLNEYGPKSVTLPTNGRLVSELNEHDLERLVGMFNGRVFLSISVDGMPMERNRPLSKIGKMLAYEDEINYKKIGSLARKFGLGFHPMLYFNSIDKWFDTIVFFFEEMGVIPYLLEVRHPISKEDSIRAVVALIKIRYYLESRVKDDKNVRLSNTITASQTPRGLGCSALTTITIMPNGDLPFCHRVIDPPWTYGNVNYGVDISKAISLNTIFNHRNVPTCMMCPIRKFCSGQCAGASYEYWGDPWIPIESICDFNRLKHHIFAKLYKDWNSMVGGLSSNLERSVKSVFGENIDDVVMKEVGKNG